MDRQLHDYAVALQVRYAVVVLRGNVLDSFGVSPCLFWWPTRSVCGRCETSQLFGKLRRLLATTQRCSRRLVVQTPSKASLAPGIAASKAGGSTGPRHRTLLRPQYIQSHAASVTSRQWTTYVRNVGGKGNSWRLWVCWACDVVTGCRYIGTTASLQKQAKRAAKRQRIRWAPRVGPRGDNSTGKCAWPFMVPVGPLTTCLAGHGHDAPPHCPLPVKSFHGIVMDGFKALCKERPGFRETHDVPRRIGSGKGKHRNDRVPKPRKVKIKPASDEPARRRSSRARAAAEVAAVAAAEERAARAAEEEAELLSSTAAVGQGATLSYQRKLELLEEQRRAFSVALAAGIVSMDQVPKHLLVPNPFVVVRVCTLLKP